MSARLDGASSGAAPHTASDKLAYTVAEAGHAIGLSRSTVFDMIRLGQIAAKKVRGRTLVARTELERVLEDAPNARPS